MADVVVASAHPLRLDGPEVRRLDEGWLAAAASPDSHPDPTGLEWLSWRPARVPGTVAGHLRDHGLEQQRSLDAEDWWFRTRFDAGSAEAGEEVLLRLGGIATVGEVYLNGECLLRSDSMFAAHAINVGTRLRGSNELAICCRALGPRLGARRKPRARWRTRLVDDGNLRWFRTMLLGRAPGFAPGPAAVGPWREVLLERRRGLAVDELWLWPRLDGETGVLGVRMALRSLAGEPPEAVEVELAGPSGRHTVELALEHPGDRSVATGELRVAGVAPWWPHTHGEAVLHGVRLSVRYAAGALSVAAGRVGFRTLAPGPGGDWDPDRDGLELHVNGMAVFCRGAVWTPVDPVALNPGRGELRATLEAARDSGMNMLRIPGTAAYEEDAFYEICDELGILVWQDFMFANLDYPFVDEGFRTSVEREASEVLARLAGRACLAVLCGNSEVEQQVAMLGLGAELGRPPFFGETLPALAKAAGADAVYVPSAPCGGDLPFRPDRGVANYYGVGGYRRPLTDARTAGVRFAAECLAFANVPDGEAIDALLPDAPADVLVHHPRWKEGVPRDRDSGWDFDDVRDHYLGLLFGLDPGELRRSDHGRYLELSRAVSGEAMAAVFGEWRREASACGGGLVLWLRDLVPGAGWGVLDHCGRPKVAYHHLRRALAPVAVWMSDEGLGGVVVHVANDRPVALSARLRVALYRDLEQQVGEARESVEVPAHGACESNVEALLGHFVDAAWAYRFAPPAQDLIVASLERETEQGIELLSQAVCFPAGRPAVVDRPERVGLEARLRPLPGEELSLVVGSRRLAYGVRVQAPGFAPADDAFAVEPGAHRTVELRPLEEGAVFTGGSLTALNVDGGVPITLVEGAP